MGTLDERRTPGWQAWVTVIAFATVPYVQLIAANPIEIPIARVAVWWAGTVAVAALALMVTARRASAPRVAVFVGLWVYVFFQYPAVGHVRRAYRLTPQAQLLMWVGVFALVTAVAILPSRRPGFQRFVAVLGALLLLVSAASYAFSAGARQDAPQLADGLATLTRAEPAETPNIWLLIPDGYSRADVLERRTGLGLTPFLDQLEDRGFDVASQARSNYPTTWASLPSMLEMRYLLDEGSHVGDLAPLFDRIRGNNAFIRTLRTWGYAYVHAYSGTAVWEGSQCVGYEDVCIGGTGLSETDWAVLRSTPLSKLLEGSVFDQVADLADPRGVVAKVLRDPPREPYAVFSHLMAPHPPFVRDESCSVRDVSGPPNTPGRPDEYRGAVTCLNHQLVAAIDQILAADPDAVIVIQSDHGHDWGLDWTDPHHATWSRQAGEDRWPELSALRLPDGCSVPDDLSPVNTLRVVLACLTDQKADLLPYHSWITVYDPEVVRRR